VLRNRNWICLALLFSSLAFAEEATVSARVELTRAGGRGKGFHSGNIVFWLSPVGTPAAPLRQLTPNMANPRLTQHNKSFEPHLLVVPVGSEVEFPNRDPFFHNVFSLFDGKRFDLGLYEAGSTRMVRFDKPGISYIFCNIHAEMSAVVIALNTPYYGISNQRGDLIITHVPFGRYTLHVWYETGWPEALNSMTREITISEDTTSLGLFNIPTTSLPPTHQNKYGKDYEPPTPDNPAYPRP
jgi:plastocyanin